MKDNQLADEILKEIPILHVNEPWAEAKLADGTLLRVKTVFINASAVVDENNVIKLDMNGDPQYMFKLSNVVEIKPLAKPERVS